jgi:hypothetical protein
MRTEKTVAPRPPCCFTAPFLTGTGDLEEIDSLRRAGEILFRDRAAADLPPATLEAPETAIRRRLLLAASELEALGAWLAEEVHLEEIEEPLLAYLVAQGGEVAGQLQATAQGLRFAVLADGEAALRSREEPAVKAPEPPQPRQTPPSAPAAFQAKLGEVAGLLRAWVRIPVEDAHPFRRKASTHSSGRRPPVPAGRRPLGGHRRNGGRHPRWGGRLALERVDGMGWKEERAEAPTSGTLRAFTQEGRFADASTESQHAEDPRGVAVGLGLRAERAPGG